MVLTSGVDGMLGVPVLSVSFASESESESEKPLNGMGLVLIALFLEPWNKGGG